MTATFNRPLAQLLRAACRLLLAGCLSYAPAVAADNTYSNGFEELNASWVLTPHPGAPTHRQQRTGHDRHSGDVAEQFHFLAQQPDPHLEISHELPHSQVYDDLTAALWVKSNHTGLRVGLLVRFPLQNDPRTGQPLAAVLPGESYTSPGEWQQLTCTTTDAAVQELVRRLRDQFRQPADPVQINQQAIIVERIVVQLDLQAGTTHLLLDDLEFGPIVPPAVVRAEPGLPRRQPRERQIRATVGDDQILIDGRTSMVLFTPYHGEEVDALSRMRFNVAWIDRFDDTALLTALNAAGLLAMANPLSREIPLEEALQPDIGLAAFTEQTSPIVFWNMGTRLSPAHLQTQAKLMDKVREADARFERPILVDVMGAEREFHRNADVISSSRHILNTSSSLRDYYDFLRRKRTMALPDRPVFTLIQTEPADANLATRADGQSLPVVEPEQIWMQGYAALAAGYKGIGYWKLTPLTAPTPGAEERRKAIALLNAHVQLLESWLAGGKFVRLVPATIGAPQPARGGVGRSRLDRLDSLVTGLMQRPEQDPPSDVQVAVFSCPQGLLLLPLWYDPQGQFQPGAMWAEELSFVVVAPENVQAWEVTTTSVTPLPNKAEKLAGGWRIRLSKFDQFTTIVLTHGEAPIRDLKQRVQALQAESARDWIDLAVAKTERVADSHGKLAAVAPSIPNADSMLNSARRYAEEAEALFSRGNFDEARLYCRWALRLTRIVQRQHWEKAVAQAGLTSGVSSPHTVCFQTLPDHWTLLREIGKRSETHENLLRSGGFEDTETFRAHGWDHHQGTDPRVRPRAELYGLGAAEGKRSLRLQADPVDPSRPPEQLADTPERIVSPPIPVYAGQIVHISGVVQVLTPLTGGTDGLIIYESTKGTVGGLRWKEPTPPKTWVPFQLIREIQHSQDLTVTIELRSLGDVRIDDLKVVALEAER